MPSVFSSVQIGATIKNLFLASTILIYASGAVCFQAVEVGIQTLPPLMSNDSPGSLPFALSTHIAFERNPPFCYRPEACLIVGIGLLDSLCALVRASVGLPRARAAKESLAIKLGIWCLVEPQDHLLTWAYKEG